MLFVVFIWPPRIRCEDRGSVQLHYGHSSYGRNRYTPEWGDGKGSAPTEPGSTGLIQERSFRGRSSGLALSDLLHSDMHPCDAAARALELSKICDSPDALKIARATA